MDKTTIDGKTVTVDDIIKQGKAFGISENRFMDFEASDPLPVGKPLRVVNYKEAGEKGTNFAHFKLVLEDKDENTYNVAVSKFKPAGVTMESESQILTPNQVFKSGKRFMAVRDNINDLPGNDARIIVQLMNKEFNVDDVNQLAIGFQRDDEEPYSSKQDAIDNGQVTRAIYKINAVA